MKISEIIHDYSQSGEQTVILKYFVGFRGTALSVGENDGQLLSNVRALALLGWGLVAVEPAPAPFAKLLKLYADRADVRLINAAITITDGPLDFWDCGVHLHKGDTSLLSTTRPETMERWKRSGEQFTKTTVRGITFKTLVKECGVSRFEMISIDAEGVDYEILCQIDLRAVGCRMLCVESNSNGDARFIEYASRHGMALRHKNFENLIFCA